jgi:hypothetical protein
MRRLGTLLLCMVLAPALGAQAPGDSGAGHARQEWRERFQKQRETWIREALGLSADQAAKLSATHEKFMAQRKTAVEEMRAIRQALRAQLRPGVAANVDSVRKLLDAEDRSTSALFQLRREEQHEIGTYLSPVQVAQLRMMRWTARFRMRQGRGMRGWMNRGMDRDHDGPGGPPDGPEGHGLEPT